MANQVPLSAETARHPGGWDALSASTDALLRRRPSLTPSYGTQVLRARLRDQIDRGVRSVPIYKIIGGEPRYRPFDRAVAGPPARPLDRAELPAIELYNVGDIYLVKDGNQRLADANARGQLFLPARVIECAIDATPDRPADLIDLLLQHEHDEFLEATGLGRRDGAAPFSCGTLGSMAYLVRHIQAYRAELSEHGQAVAPPDAAARWYAEVFRPVASVARRKALAGPFPGRGDAELYLWAIDHRWRTVPGVQPESLGGLRGRVRFARRQLLALWLGLRQA